MISGAGNTKHRSSRKHIFAATVKYLGSGKFRAVRHAGVMLSGNLHAAIEIHPNMSKGITNMLNLGVEGEQRNLKDIDGYHNKSLWMSAIIIE